LALRDLSLIPSRCDFSRAAARGLPALFSLLDALRKLLGGLALVVAHLSKQDGVDL
jgi:hypothetical protein